MEELEIISIKSDDKIRKKHKRSRSKYEDQDANKRRKRRHRESESESEDETEDNSSEIVEVFSDIRHKRKKGKRRKKKKRRRSKSNSEDDYRYNNIKREKRINGIKKEIVVNVDSHSESDYEDSGNDSANSHKYKRYKNENKDHSHSSKHYPSSVKRRKHHRKDSNKHDELRSKEKRQSDWKRSKHYNHYENEREHSEKYDHRKNNKGRSRYENFDHRQDRGESSKKNDYIDNDRERYNNIDHRQNQKKKSDDVDRSQIGREKSSYEDIDHGRKEKGRLSHEKFNNNQIEREISHHRNIEKDRSENIDHSSGNRNSTKKFNDQIDHRQSEMVRSDNNAHTSSNRNITKNVIDKERSNVENNVNDTIQLLEISDKEDNVSASSLTNIITLKKALERLGNKDKEKPETSASLQKNNERELGSSLYKNTEEILRWIRNTEAAANLPSSPDISSPVENEMHQDEDIDIITEIRKPQKPKQINSSHAQAVNNGRQKENSWRETVNNIHKMNIPLTSNQQPHQKRISQDDKEHDPKSSRTLKPTLKPNPENPYKSSNNSLRFSDSERQNLSKLDKRETSLERSIQDTSYKDKRLPSKKPSDFVSSILEKFPNLQKQSVLASNCVSSKENDVFEIVANKSFIMNDNNNKQSQLNPHEEIVLCDTEIPQVNAHSRAGSSKSNNNNNNNNKNNSFDTKEKSGQYNQFSNFSVHGNNNKQPDDVGRRIDKKEIKNSVTILSESIAEKSCVKINSQNNNSVQQPQNRPKTPTEEVILCDSDNPLANINNSFNNINNRNLFPKDATTTKGQEISNSKEKSFHYNRSNSLSKEESNNKNSNNINDKNNGKGMKNNSSTMLSDIVPENIGRNNSQNEKFHKQPPNDISIPPQEEIVLFETESSPVIFDGPADSSSDVKFDSTEKSSSYNVSYKYPKHDDKGKHPNNDNEIRSHDKEVQNDKGKDLNNSRENRINNKDVQNICSDTLVNIGKHHNNINENRNNNKDVQKVCSGSIDNIIKQYIREDNSIQYISASPYLLIASIDFELQPNVLSSVSNEERDPEQVKDLELRLSANKQEKGKANLVDSNRSKVNEQEQSKANSVDTNKPKALLNPAKSWQLRVAAAKERNKNKISTRNKNMVDKDHQNSSIAAQNDSENVMASSSNLCQNKNLTKDKTEAAAPSTFSENDDTNDNADFEKNICPASTSDILKSPSLEDDCASSEDGGRLFQIENVQGNISFNDDSSVNYLNSSDTQTSGLNAQIKKENIIKNSSVIKENKQNLRHTDIKEEIDFSNEIHQEVYDQVDSKAFVRTLVSNECLENGITENQVNSQQNIRADALSEGLNDNNLDNIQDNFPESEENLSMRAHDDESISNNDFDDNYSLSENEVEKDTNVNNSQSENEMQSDVENDIDVNQSVSENEMLNNVDNDIDVNYSENENEVQNEPENNLSRPVSPESNTNQSVGSAHSSTMLKIGDVWSTATASKENPTHYPIPEDLAEVVEIGRVEVTKISARSFSIKKECSEARNYYVSHTDIENCPKCQHKLNSEEFKFNPRTMILTMVCKCTLTIYQLINPEKYNNINIR